MGSARKQARSQCDLCTRKPLRGLLRDNARKSTNTEEEKRLKESVRNEGLSKSCRILMIDLLVTISPLILLQRARDELHCMCRRYYLVYTVAVYHQLTRLLVLEVGWREHELYCHPYSLINRNHELISEI